MSFDLESERSVVSSISTIFLNFIGFDVVLSRVVKSYVNLAFSNPQFETYLIQHFELKKTKNKKTALISELEIYLKEVYKKDDLSWFNKMIDEDPAKLDNAIRNSNKLINHAKPPFLTVQKLTKRLLEFAK